MSTEWSENKFYHYSATEYAVNQQNILELLQGLSEVKLLDVGCGDGKFSLEIMKRTSPCELYGIDNNKSIIKESQMRGIDVIIVDAQHLPFLEESFDIVVTNQVIEHVLNVDQFLNEVRRVVKKNGIFLLSTPNLCALHNRLLVMIGQQPTCLHVSEIQVGNVLKGVKTHGHIHAFSPSALRDLLKYNNFTVEKMRGTGMYPFPRFLSKILSKIFPQLAAFMICKARRIR